MDMNDDQLKKAVRVLNTLPPSTVTMIEPPRLYTCVGCESTTKKLNEMQRITGTKLVPQVVDVICRACWATHLQECKQFARIICAGCGEVVLAMEPHKERSGYTWLPGSFAHVAHCPTCTQDKEQQLRPSPVAEKIAFYKANNIPYEQ